MASAGPYASLHLAPTDNHMPARFFTGRMPSHRLHPALLYSVSVEACIRFVDDADYVWLCANGMALNPDKSEAILLGSRQRAHSYSSLATVNVAGSQIHLDLADRIKILTSSSRLTVMTRDERQR